MASKEFFNLKLIISHNLNQFIRFSIGLQWFIILKRSVASVEFFRLINIDLVLRKES